MTSAERDVSGAADNEILPWLAAGAASASGTLVVHRDSRAAAAAGATANSGFETPSVPVSRSGGLRGLGEALEGEHDSGGTVRARGSGAARMQRPDNWGDDLGYQHGLPPPRLQQQQDEEEEEDNSYLAALKSAVADREREHQQQQQRSGQTPGSGRKGGVRASGEAAGGQDDAGAAAAEALAVRFRSYCEAGTGSANLPFLSAAMAAPMGLLNPMVTPGLSPMGNRGLSEGLDPDAYMVLQQLCRVKNSMALGGGRGRVSGAQSTESGGGLGAGYIARGPSRESVGVGGEEGPGWDFSRMRGAQGRVPVGSAFSHQQSAAAAGGGGKIGEGQGGAGGRGVEDVVVPLHVMQKVLQSPAVQNLARSLGYHQACLELMPLDEAGAAGLQQVVADMTMTLRTILQL